MQDAHLEDENLLALGVDLRVQQAHVLAQVANQRLLTFPEPPLGLQNATVTLTPCNIFDTVYGRRLQRATLTR
jgi:hypothetical protein